MKFIDGELDEAAAVALRDHIADCTACASDFAVYDALDGVLSDVFTSKREPAPDGFTASVMESIAALPNPKRSTASFERLLYILAGSFSLLFGLGFLLAANRDTVIDIFSDIPFVIRFVDAATPAVDAIGTVLTSIGTAFSDAFWAVQGFVSDNRLVIGGVAVTLLVVAFAVLSVKLRTDRKAKAKSK